MKTLNLATFLLLVSSPAIAQDRCRIYENTENQSSTQIQERGAIRRQTITENNGIKRCRVDFMVKIGPNWHPAGYEHRFGSNQGFNEGCAIAVHEAEREIMQSVGRQQVKQTSRMICDDDPDRRALSNANPGTVVNITQLKPHPDFPKNFAHNGTTCRWFLEPNWNGNQIRQWQGIACEVQDGRWVVVDRF
jgi:hypothetical protein